MVIDDELLEIVRRSLGDTKSVLITGGTGFVGGRLADVLVEAGHDVTVTGRSKYRLRSRGNFLALDITRQSDVEKACEGKQIVFHCAAFTSPWGSLEIHRKINVGGTSNVVQACERSGVSRLVHVSSTAIHFEFRDRQVSDDCPMPKKFANAYAQSKAEAESVVTHAIEHGLNAYIVRARAVFGPGDNALLPRLIAAAGQGRLRQIGNGENLCDLTYVDNLIAGLVLASDPEKPTGVCTITNKEPIQLWPSLNRVFKSVTGKEVGRKVPVWLAMRIAHLAELRHRLFKLSGEPKLTRYGVGLLAKQQTFVSKAADEQLGYEPIVTMEDGIERTIDTLLMRNEKPVAHEAEVDVRLYSTGYVAFTRNLAERGAKKEQTRFRAVVAMIRHPSFGVTLFDTGYDSNFFEATQKWPYRIYRYATSVVTKPEWTIARQLEMDGIPPESIDRIVFSHFHADHICGLDAFPNADFIASNAAWQAVKGRRGVSAIRRAFVPGLLPADFQQRLHTIDHFHSPGIGPLANCHDLFRDGSVRLFRLDGHAKGQMGVLLRLRGGRQMFLLADTFWTGEEIRKRRKPTFGFRMIADDYAAAIRSREAIFEIAKSFPDIELVPTHCPDIEIDRDATR